MTSATDSYMQCVSLDSRIRQIELADMCSGAVRSCYVGRLEHAGRLRIRQMREVQLLKAGSVPDPLRSRRDVLGQMGTEQPRHEHRGWPSWHR